MKKLFFLVFIVIFLIGAIPVEAQQKIKKDHWELELSYGQFWIVKDNLPSNMIFEQTKNADFQLAMRLRIWRGWYVGLVGGLKKETQNEYFTDVVYTNYWWAENRFGNFLAKNYIERWVSNFKPAIYIGAETKLNLFTIKFSKAVGLSPYGKIGIQKWFSVEDGFIYTKDFTLYDLDKSETIPYMIYNVTAVPLGGGRCHAEQTIWWANPDGSKGAVFRKDVWDGFMSQTRPGLIVFYAGGLSLKIERLTINGEVNFQKRRDTVYEAGTGNFYGHRGFRYLMWHVGLGYRF